MDTEFDTREAWRKLDVWNHVAPQSCSVMLHDPAGLDVVSNVALSFGRAIVELNWSIKFNTT